jgi:magnesium chelatase family protein
VLAQTYSLALCGVEAQDVLVEVDLAGGLPLFDIVGLPDASVRESRDRVRAALRNSGFGFPAGRVIVNLAPAHMPKAGPAFDLPIAIALLIAWEKLPKACGQRSLFAGVGQQCYGAHVSIPSQLQMGLFYNGLRIACEIETAPRGGTRPPRRMQ